MARRNTEKTENNNQQADLLRGMGEICDYLRCSPATALKWIAELELPCRKTQLNGGGQWISSKSALNSWAESIVKRKS